MKNLHSQSCQPFFKILTLLTEGNNHSSGGPSSLPCFTQLVLQRVWEAAESCPYSALDWLAGQVTRSRLVHQWVLSSLDSWLEHFLIAHGNQRVRNGMVFLIFNSKLYLSLNCENFKLYINFIYHFLAAGFLLVSLVPSTQFRQGFRAAHRLQREPQLTAEAQGVLHQVYNALLRLLPAAKHYTDAQLHGTMKLTTYFTLLMYCCISRTEKLMVNETLRNLNFNYFLRIFIVYLSILNIFQFGQHFLQLWHLFHPKLSEPSIPAHHNKQTLLAFWNHACTDCPENVQLMLQNAHVTKNIAFNYIL